MIVAVWFDGGRDDRSAQPRWYSRDATLTDMVDFRLRLNQLAADLYAGTRLIPPARAEPRTLHLSDNTVLELTAADVLLHFSRLPGQKLTTFDFLACARPTQAQVETAKLVIEQVAQRIVLEALEASPREQRHGPSRSGVRPPVQEGADPLLP